MIARGAEAKADEPALSAALSAYRDGEYALARKRLEAALQTLRAPMERAVAHVHLGWIAFSENRRDDAARHLETAAQIEPGFTPVDGHTPPDPSAWYRGLRESWRGLLVVAVPGTVLVDKLDALPTPCVLPIDVGVHRIVVRAADGLREAVHDKLVVRPRARVTPEVVWRPRAGTLALVVEPASAKATVDGRDVPTLPARLSVPAGIRRVELSAPGYLKETRSARVEAETVTTLVVGLSPLPLPKAVDDRPWYRRRMTWGTLALSTGGAVAVAGLIAGLKARATEQTLRTEETGAALSTTRFNQLAGSATTWANAANGMFIAAGALAVTGAFLFLVGETSPPRATGTRVSLGLNGLGLTLEVRLDQRQPRGYKVITGGEPR